MFLPGVADGGRCPLRDRVPDPDCAVAVGAPAAVLRHSAGTERKFQNGSQGEHGGSRLDFVDFNSGVPAVRPFAMPYLPNFHLKLNWLNLVICCSHFRNWLGGINLISKCQLFCTSGNPVRVRHRQIHQTARGALPVTHGTLWLIITYGDSRDKWCRHKCPNLLRYCDQRYQESWS